MARHLPNTTTAPPGQWRYRMPETGQTFGPVPDLDGLLRSLEASYRANGYEIPPNLAELVEQFICNDKPEYCTGSEGPSLDLKQIAKITFHIVAAATKKLVGKDERVSAEQANARAAVCASGAPGGARCSENVPRTDCTNCNLETLRHIVLNLIGDRKTTNDSQLDVCRACLCELKAKVWLPMSRLEKLMTEEDWARLPAHCWTLKERSSNAS